MERIKERKEELKESLKNTYCDNICDYNHGYICDIIMEISDSNVDIYTSDLLEWLKDNYSVVEEANQEFGTPNDIIKQCQQGQYYQNSQELYDNFEDMILLFAYDYLYSNEINLQEEQLEELEERLEDIDNNNQLEDIIEIIEELQEHEEENEEEGE